MDKQYIITSVPFSSNLALFLFKNVQFVLFWIFFSCNEQIIRFVVVKLLKFLFVDQYDVVLDFKFYINGFDTFLMIAQCFFPQIWRVNISKYLSLIFVDQYYSKKPRKTVNCYEYTFYIQHLSIYISEVGRIVIPAQLNDYAIWVSNDDRSCYIVHW